MSVLSKLILTVFASAFIGFMALGSVASGAPDLPLTIAIAGLFGSIWAVAVVGVWFI